MQLPHPCLMQWGWDSNLYWLPIWHLPLTKLRLGECSPSSLTSLLLEHFEINWLLVVWPEFFAVILIAFECWGLFQDPTLPLGQSGVPQLTCECTLGVARELHPMSGSFSPRQAPGTQRRGSHFSGQRAPSVWLMLERPCPWNWHLAHPELAVCAAAPSRVHAVGGMGSRTAPLLCEPE